MASSRKPPSAEPFEAALRGRRVTVGLSGGVDSVVLLHLLRSSRFAFRLRAVHVHHGLSPNADDWARFCRALCRRWKVPLTVRRVNVARSGSGLEDAARAARHAAFRSEKCDVIALAHHLDDQAETVLLNLLRGAGGRGAAGMAFQSDFDDGKKLLRPLLDVPREEIRRYAARNRLEWIEDESNLDESFARNFIRRRVGPVIAERFPRWRESLARAARHFAEDELSANRLLREYLAGHGLRAPSEAKLAEMLKQLASGSARTRIEHDGGVLRTYRGQVFMEKAHPPARIASLAWRGEARMPLPGFGGTLSFRRVRGQGIDARLLQNARFLVQARRGGERLQPDERRPRRTLKNLLQEAGVPPWQRDRLPLLFCDGELAWVPGIGTDVRFRPAAGAAGLLPDWRFPS